MPRLKQGIICFLVARGGISKIIYQPFRVKIEVFTHYLIVIKTSKKNSQLETKIQLFLF